MFLTNASGNDCLPVKGGVFFIGDLSEKLKGVMVWL